VRILSGAGTGTTVEFTLKRPATGAAPTESSPEISRSLQGRVTGS
jgi:hypothetical protein